MTLAIASVSCEGPRACVWCIDVERCLDDGSSCVAPFIPDYEPIDFGDFKSDLNIGKVTITMHCQRCEQRDDESIVPFIDAFEKLETVDLDVMHDQLVNELEAAALDLLRCAVTVARCDGPIGGDELHDVEIEHVPPLVGIARRLRAVKHVRSYRR